jgi:hypothetical protein
MVRLYPAVRCAALPGALPQTVREIACWIGRRNRALGRAALPGRVTRNREAAMEDRRPLDLGGRYGLSEQGIHSRDGPRPCLIDLPSLPAQALHRRHRR